MDNVNLDLSDSEFIESDDALEPRHQVLILSTVTLERLVVGATKIVNGRMGQMVISMENSPRSSIASSRVMRTRRTMKTKARMRMKKTRTRTTRHRRQLLNEVTDFEFADRKREAEVASTGNL